MVKRRMGKRIIRPATEEERLRHAKIREQIEQEKPRLRAIGLAAKRDYDARRTGLRDAVAALKRARQEQGLSLADVGARAGIGKSNLSRLENAPNANPTIETLTRYAAAVGMRIEITLAGLKPARQ